VLAKYPNVRLVYGSLDDVEIIEKEAAAADVVVHTADSADNLPSAQAISKGLKAGHSEANPGYWIHLSGTGILTWYDADNKRLGEAPLPDQEYNDVQGIDAILSLPDSAMHRDIDKIVLATNSSAVKTLIVAPPTIYGVGNGPVNTRSQQVPSLADFALKKGFAPIIAPGATEWDNVHIHDLGRAFVSFVEATQDSAKSSNPEILGPRAYYFLRGGVHRWGDVATKIAEEAHKQGYLPEASTKTLPIKEAVSYGISASTSWGLNSKGVPERAKKYFGWAPTEKSLDDEIAGAVKFEAEKLKLTPKAK